MPHQSNKQAIKGDATSTFIETVRQILSISKEELDKREAAYKQDRAVKKASRKAKLSCLFLIALCCLFTQPAYADAQERAQILKARLLQKLVGDGWQLAQESQSLLVVERPAEGSFGFIAQAFMTGANGTKPMIRWSFTLIPTNDHYTYYSYVGTVNSQNAFGQMKSWPLKNKKDTAYINSVMQWASDGLPAKYKFRDSR